MKYYQNKGYFYKFVSPEIINEVDKVTLYYLDIDKKNNIHFRIIKGYMRDGTKYKWRSSVNASAHVYRYRVDNREGVVFKRMLWLYDDKELNPLSEKEKKYLAIEKLLEEETTKKKEYEERVSWIDKNITYLQCYKSLMDWKELS